jgi:tol-pal system protein YbgF
LAQLQQTQQQQAEQLNILQQQLEAVRQQAPEIFANYDAGLQVQQPAATPLIPAPQATTIPAVISQELTELADSASSYLAAFSNLAAGRFAVAESGFNDFLAQYANHQYSSNARYWLASAQFSQGKLQSASSNLRQIIVTDSSQQRAPAALLMLAKVYQQQQKYPEAEDVLEQLRNRYPDSSEAQQFFQDTVTQ